MDYSSNQEITATIMARLIAGHLPAEWASTEDVQNEADAPAWAAAIFAKAKALIKAVEGTPTRKESKDVHAFSNTKHSPLGSSLKALGWQQFAAQVQHFRTRDQCAVDETPYRRYRYTVHAWKHLDTGLIIGAKIKLAGKYMPQAVMTPAGRFVAHADHGLGPNHLAVIDEWLGDEWPGTFRMGVVDLPEGCPDLMCGLYGPAVGDNPITEYAVVYEKRGNRPGPSRLIDQPHRPARRMVVIAGPGRNGEGIVYTAYGTNAASPAPREWWDSSMKPEEAMEAAAFWAVHALAKD